MASDTVNFAMAPVLLNAVVDIAKGQGTTFSGSVHCFDVHFGPIAWRSRSLTGVSLVPAGRFERSRCGCAVRF